MIEFRTRWTAAHGIAEITAQIDDWDAASQGIDAPFPYCGRPYNLTALETYHQKDDPMLVCAYAEDEIAGVLALVKRPMVRLGQIIHEVGFPFNPNTIVNHPLIDVTNFDHVVSVATGLIEGAFASGADSLLLDHMPVGGRFAEAFLVAARALGMPCDMPMPARALHYGTLGGDWDAYLASRSRNHRWQIKKAMRKVSDDPNIKVTRCDDRKSIYTHLEDWFSVERNSWQGGDSDTAMSDADRFFHRQLIENLPEQMLGDLWMVYVKEQPVAALRMLAAPGQVSVHTMHFDANFKAEAPGAIAFHAMMQAACDAGLVEVDMHGTTAFFSRYSTGKREHQSLRIYRKGLRGIMLQKMRSGLKAVQEFKAAKAPVKAP